jgi:dynein heavy chain
MDDQEKNVLPLTLRKKLHKFQLLIISKILRPDKVYENVQKFVKNQMEPKFIEPPTFDLNTSYNDSLAHIPLIFILAQGEDPLKHFYKLARDKYINHKIISVSLGQGQGSVALKAVETAISTGSW